MADYANEGNQVWTCPGHNGGIFYWKSPVGRLFVEHLGEPIFRNDLDMPSFAAGSMAPKVAAACAFVRATGQKACIGALSDLSEIIAGRRGTIISAQPQRL